MVLRLRFSRPLLALLLLALPAPAVLTAATAGTAATAAAAAAPQLSIVDPTQQALFADLFLEALGPHPSFARDLLPGHADEHLSWFPLQLLVPFSSTAAAGSPVLGYPIATDGSTVEATPTMLGTLLGSGTAGAAQSPSGNACYLAQSSTNDLAGYAVDLATTQLTNAPGAPFATDSGPEAVTTEPSGRFVYAANGSGKSVTAYTVNLATRALTKIGSTSTTATQPRSISATRQCVFVTNTGSGGYEAFAIDAATGALSSVPGSPFGSHQSTSLARTGDGNFVYFSPVTPPGEIEGFFVDPATCALSAVPGSPFTGPAGGVLRINADVPVIYSAGSGILQAFAIDPATGALSPLGSPVSIGPQTGAMVVGPKGANVFLSDLSTHNLRNVTLDTATGTPKAAGAPVAGPANVQSMLLFSENGTQVIGQGIAQNRGNRTLGGAPPYTYALIGGALPAGLSFDTTSGDVTGTPTTLGQTSFEVKVTDAVGATSSSVRALEVAVPPAAPAAPSNLTASVTSATEVALDWQDNANQTAAFQISLSQDGGPFLEVQAARPQATSANVSGLSPATSYTFRVRAQNAGGGATDNTTATVTTQALPPAACTPSANSQCLLDGRFRLEAIYQDAHGDAGLANVVAITSDTAYLWFFQSSNVEAVVKVLDGCALGGHFWVFAGGLTDVHVILRLTDTQTGAVRYYEVPNGPAFTPIQDTAAFGTCSDPKAGRHAVPGAATTLLHAAAADLDARLRAAAARNLPPTVPVPATVPALTTVPATGPGCVPSSTALCLNNNRFRVQATFDAGSAGSGNAQVGGLTSDTGYLWFFSASNVEAIVKVLDGCGLNGSYWVFAGGLTDVQVNLTVTDTQTGKQRQYNNPSNTTFEPVQDTSAFPTCP